MNHKVHTNMRNAIPHNDYGVTIGKILIPIIPNPELGLINLIHGPSDTKRSLNGYPLKINNYSLMQYV